MQTSTTSTPGQRTHAEAAGPSAPLGALLNFMRSNWRDNVIYIGFAVVFVYFAATLHDSGFLTAGNIMAIVKATATISVMAVAMTFVISAAEIDLSIGAVAGLSSVVTAMTVADHGWLAGILAGLAVGLVVGAINGGLVTLLRIPSFLVTLGMLGMASGTAQWVTASAAQPVNNPTYVSIFGGTVASIGGLDIPGVLLWTVGFAAVGAVVLNKTTFGRQVLATGGNPVAAEFTGVKTRRIKFSVLVLMAVVAAIGGMLYAGRLRTGRYTLGEGDELSVIAAVILGGTSLFGGYGRVIGSVFGSLMIGLINNGLILAGLGVEQQKVIRGAIIVLAVALARRK